MTDLVAKLRLEASAGNTSQVLNAVARDTAQVGAAGTKAATGLREAGAGAATFERSAGQARAAGLALGSALAAIGGAEFVKNLKEAALATAGLTTGLSAVTGGAIGAADAQAYIRSQAERLGLVVRQSTEDYLQLAAATNGTSLAGQKTKDIWLGLNEAGIALNRTDEQRKRALEAIAQIAGKGVVSQEEMRQQLAEALPGATQVAARAMGMTTQAFNKLVDSGKLLSEDFLPKFAAQLSKEFGSKIDEQLATPIGRARQEFAAFKNTLDGLSATAGTAFLTGLVDGFAQLNDELASADIKTAAESLGKTLGQGLGDAAKAAAVLADHLSEVEAAAGAVVAVGLARWLIATSTEARAAAAAFLAKGEAAKAAGAISVTTAQGETVAVTSLRGAIVATAEAEVAAATAARDLAVANEQAAAASLAQARAQAANLTSTMALAEKQALVAVAERELAAAQSATVAATVQAEAATIGLAKASTAGGAAMQGLKSVGGGLLSLIGGPWGAAFLLGAGAVGAVTSALAENKRIQEDEKKIALEVADATRQTAEALGPAASGVKAFSKESLEAIGNTNALADAVRGLTGETIRYASAKATAASQRNTADFNTLQAQIAKLDNPGLLQRAGRLALGSIDSFAARQGVLTDFEGKTQRDAARANLVDLQTRPLLDNIHLLLNPASYKPDAPELPKLTPVGNGNGSKADQKAVERAHDLEAARTAQEAYTKALLAGGSALDEWKIKDAGRLAVERLSIDQRKNLTAAEQALIERVRTSAEETERLKIANDRIEKSIGIQKSAKADTLALEARSVAAAQGEAALEALQVKEAGLAALQQIGVNALDQLTGATLDHAKAAVAAAEAKERQSIATQKAERVADQIRDLDARIASEQGYAVAIAAGTEALVAYQRAEFERQEIERAGKNLTADQVAALKAKADELFAVRAAADSADLNRRQAEELRLSKMTTQERAVEERYLQRKSLLLAEHVDWTKEEVEARARALALADEAAAQDAKAIGDLKEGLRKTFIESGRLGFDDVGDFVEQRLRQAVYDALLAKPIDILINAVVGSVSGMNALSGGGVGQLGGAGGLGSLFTSAGQLAGLTTSASKLATSVLSKIGLGNASGVGATIGGAVGGAGTGMLVSSVAGLLGLNQSKGNQIGSTIGGAIGSFIPIPGGSIIGSIAGNLIGGLIGGKKSTEAAVASLDAQGNIIGMGGAKRTDQTTAAATQIAQAIQQIETALVAGGATLTATVSKIDIGTRDPTHLNFSNGQSIDTAVGDVSAAIDTATKTILANAKWATEAQTAYAQKMLAAGATIDQVVSALSVAGGFTGSIDDAIAQLTDPAAYAKKQALDAIDANYQALKKQGQDLIAAGLATEDVLGKIDKLKDLQVEDALKRFVTAVQDATNEIDPTAFAKSVADGIAALKDPTGFERSKALSDIDANITAMKAQAAGLVAAGKLSTEIFAQLDQLHDLQVADSVKKLGDAATDAAKALQTAADDAAKALKQAADAQKAASDFGASIDDAILQLTDPIAAQIDRINRDYATKVGQAKTMVDAGQLGADVFDKLANLRDLQIEDVLKGLADAGKDATDAFADARPRLQAWLDSLGVSSNSPLNPGEQRQSAMDSYERMLSRARGGDADALSQITSLADQLLSADRNSTSSASDRLALYNKVQGDIKGLTAMYGPAVGANPQVQEAVKANTLLKEIARSLDPTLIATRPPQPVEVKLSPWLQTADRTIVLEQTQTLSRLLTRVIEAEDNLAKIITDALESLSTSLRDGLEGLGETVLAGAEKSAAAAAHMAEQLADLAQTQALTNTYMRQSAARG